MNTILLGLLSISAVAVASPARPAVSLRDAKRVALARVDGGTIKSAELERERGELIYSFDIIDRRRRIIEVHVDANTGDVVGVEEESAQKERDEAGHKLHR